MELWFEIACCSCYIALSKIQIFCDSNFALSKFCTIQILLDANSAKYCTIHPNSVLSKSCTIQNLSNPNSARSKFCLIRKSNNPNVNIQYVSWWLYNLIYFSHLSRKQKIFETVNNQNKRTLRSLIQGEALIKGQAEIFLQI